MADHSSNDSRSAWRTVGVAVSIPSIMAATLLVGVFLGRFADSRLSTSPWLTLLGLFLGMAAGIREILLILRKLNTRD